MSIPQSAAGDPIESLAQLPAYLESGCTPPSRWVIGTEHEKFGFRVGTNTPLPYEGEAGVRAMLEGLQRFGWQPVCEGDTLVGLSLNGASISLEPGGQFELSGAPLDNLHQTCDEVHTHLHQVASVAKELGVGFLGLGSSPRWSLEETPIMPKGRYGIMRRYMAIKGTMGWDMMFRTSTIQVNLDFASEADMIRKLRVGIALQPVATALFANSPFLDGKPTGYLSYRAHVWTDTDRDRTGGLPFVFEDGFGFERYADYALDVPMYFIYRDGRYIDVAGRSFRDFLDGKLPELPGERPTMNDWADHLTTIFPEARLKKFIEMRGADGGPWSRICALPAFWVGLLYAQGPLDASWDLVKEWREDEREQLRRDVMVKGLKAQIRGRSVQSLAQELLGLARAGLRERGRADISADETGFLDTLDEIAESGCTPAEALLARYHGPWGGSIEPIFEECAF